MNTVNFFQPLMELLTEGEVTFNVEVAKNGYMMVSVLYTHKNVKDSSFKRIPPLIFKGYAKELDEKLFTALASPMRKTVGLAVNLLDYEKTLEQISKESKANQKKQAGKNMKPAVNSISLSKDDDEMEVDDEEEVTPDSAKSAAELLAEEKQKRFEKIMVEVDALANTGNYTGAWMKVPAIAEFPEMVDTITTRKSELSAKFAA